MSLRSTSFGAFSSPGPRSAIAHSPMSSRSSGGIHCDIIVGFPGETEAQFQETYDVLAELKLDKIHLARYSPRPGTVSARRMADDVPDEEKRRRFHLIEALQKDISEEKMRQYMGQTVEVLVEGEQRGRWRSRNPQNKLVFFDDPRDLKGQIVQVKINHTGVWSMSGTVVGDTNGKEMAETAVFHDTIPLTVI